ncbi:Transcriptional protein [Yarrowia sp. B02]|nr:Transcriptional protein [Yarrowia sp. B02]
MKTKIPRRTSSSGQEDYSDVPLPKMKARRSRSPKKAHLGDILGLEEISSITKATQEIRNQLDLDFETHSGEPPALRFENKLLLIIDTNFAISHLSLLKELSNLHAQYGHVLIVPWAVIKELDGLKNSGRIEYKHRAGAVSTGDDDMDLSLGQRARLSNAWIFDQLGARSQSLFGQKVSERLGESTKGDDAILDCCRYFQHKADAFVVILSDDKNLCMKALIHEIMTVSYQEGMTADTIAQITAEEYCKNMGEMMDMDMETDGGSRPQMHLAPPIPPPQPTPPPRHPIRQPQPVQPQSARQVQPVRQPQNVPQPRPQAHQPQHVPQPPSPGPRQFEHIDDPKIEHPDQLLPELEKVVFKVLRMAVAFQAPNHNVQRATSIGSISDIMEQLRTRELSKFQFPNLRQVRPGSKAPAPERLAFLRGLMHLSADMEKTFAGEYPKNYVDAVEWVLGLVNSAN